MINPHLSCFPLLTPGQVDQYARMEQIYRAWNAVINVISRKDIDQFSVHHLQHSLSIGKIIAFKSGTRILDAGTGGGFPGIPLAVLFPDVHFTLVDSIGKKIKVVNAIAGELNLKNVSTTVVRFESLKKSFDFVTGRAVSNLPLFVSMVKSLVKTPGFNDIPNGVLYLTGGEVAQDIMKIKAKTTIWQLSDFFDEDYFSTKKLVHLYDFK
jgi:16S rRNA (guanine527-N7)-methyltransferase